ncbi:hypothetical protein Tco_0303214 [Tanacetum coccineum]
MMSDSSGDGLSDLDDIDDLEMIMQQVQTEQEQEEEVERVHHRNYIYRERLDAEERLMPDYFGPNPKYPDIVCTGNEVIAQKHGMGILLEIQRSNAPYLNGDNDSARKEDLKELLGVTSR